MDFTNASLSPRQRLLLRALRGPVTTAVTTADPGTHPTPQDHMHHEDNDVTSLRAELVEACTRAVVVEAEMERLREQHQNEITALTCRLQSTQQAFREVVEATLKRKGDLRNILRLICRDMKSKDMSKCHGEMNGCSDENNNSDSDNNSNNNNSSNNNNEDIVKSSHRTGDLTGDLTGHLTGSLTADLTGDLTGNLTGDLTGDLTRDLTGEVDILVEVAAMERSLFAMDEGILSLTQELISEIPGIVMMVMQTLRPTDNTALLTETGRVGALEPSVETAISCCAGDADLPPLSLPLPEVATPPEVIVPTPPVAATPPAVSSPLVVIPSPPVVPVAPTPQILTTTPAVAPSSPLVVPTPVVAPLLAVAPSPSVAAPSIGRREGFWFFQAPPPFLPPLFEESSEDFPIMPVDGEGEGEGDWVDIK